MPLPLRFASAALTFALLVWPGFAQQHHHHGAEGGDPVIAMEKFGDVSMPISCAATQQKPFERGIALLHSFWFEEAYKQFDAVSKADPDCAMAWWGMAMTEWRPAWDGMPADRRDKGIAEIDKATALKPKTDREREYVGSLSALMHSDPKVREQASADYAVALGKLHDKYPEDVEAQAFYGLQLAMNGGVTDPVGDMRKALVVLEPGFAAHPNHPGFAHYIVHACDMPQLAQEGLPAAQRYASIAPSSPHALHMPGHIFARLGMWDEDIVSNEASVKASEDAEHNHQGGVAHQMHAYEFLFYAYLQEGDDANAKRIALGTGPLVKHLASLPEVASDGMAGMMPMVQVEFPGIYELELRDWSAALATKEVTDPSPYASLLLGWVRGIAAGHLRDRAAAVANQTKLDGVMATMRSHGVTPQQEVGLTLYGDTVHAWTLFAQHKDAKALALISKTADLQDRFGQGEVDIPVREMYADMLLEDKRPADALAQYKVSLQLSPRRFNGLYGAGRAAEAAGKPEEAKAFYAQLLEVTHGGLKTSRPEIVHAREMVTTKLAQR